jgi:hypothetical protein
VVAVNTDIAAFGAALLFCFGLVRGWAFVRAFI